MNIKINKKYVQGMSVNTLPSERWKFDGINVMESNSMAGLFSATFCWILICIAITLLNN